uniref:Son of sevenless n=1 Tax=Noccaea caerulescens TaxID=107243 RepID=A0A1J3D1Y8_NOCCA
MDTNRESNSQKFEIESSSPDHQFHSMNALEILRETVGILRYNLVAFMLIAAFLICPVSAILLPNILVDQSVVNSLTVRLLLLAKSSGLPLVPFVRNSCQKFSETAVSSATCFPLFVTLSLLSRAAVVYSVDCTYSRRKVAISKFFVIMQRLWKRLVFTYLWICFVIVVCLTSFCVFLVAVCSSFFVLGFSPDFNAYGAVLIGLGFSVVFANVIIICNTTIVISILEDVSGPLALVRANDLIKGQTQVGLLIFLGSTIGLTFMEGLFEHRVKSLSYGDGSSRVWEGPLLVLMYSFVVLIDTMMSAVFYFSCRSYSMEAVEALEASGGETRPILETVGQHSSLL